MTLRSVGSIPASGFELSVQSLLGILSPPLSLPLPRTLARLLSLVLKNEYTSKDKNV